MKGLPFVLAFTAMTFVAWGAYGPLLHHGTASMGRDSLRAFVGVGIAYFFIAVLVPIYILRKQGESGKWTISGTLYSLIAGAVGAIGALGVILALSYGGMPVYVMPLVFGFAPIVNTLVTAWMSKTFDQISPIFIGGIVVASLGVGGVLAFKPTAPPHVQHPTPESKTEEQPDAATHSRVAQPALLRYVSTVPHPLPAPQEPLPPVVVQPPAPGVPAETPAPETPAPETPAPETPAPAPPAETPPATPTTEQPAESTQESALVQAAAPAAEPQELPPVVVQPPAPVEPQPAPPSAAAPQEPKQEPKTEVPQVAEAPAIAVEKPELPPMVVQPAALQQVFEAAPPAAVPADAPAAAPQTETPQAEPQPVPATPAAAAPELEKPSAAASATTPVAVPSQPPQADAAVAAQTATQQPTSPEPASPEPASPDTESGRAGSVRAAPAAIASRDKAPASANKSPTPPTPNVPMIILSIVVAAICWGSYGPMLHQGQARMGGSRLRPFTCVGLAYFFIAVAAPLAVIAARTADTGSWSVGGLSWSIIAGAAGAIGALGVILAFNAGGKPYYVMPLVFGFAPVINTCISLTEAGTWGLAKPQFWISLAVVIAGAITVLINAPKPQHAKPHGAPAPDAGK